MPTRRIPRSEGIRDSAGRITAAERERFAMADDYCTKAEMAGLDTSEWYREAMEDLVKLKESCNGIPTTAIVMRMFRDCVTPIELGLEEAGVNSDGLVPQLPALYDLMIRTQDNGRDR